MVIFTTARTRFLASVTAVAEAETAVAAGADIVDCKDPSRGALGALDAAVVRAIRAAVPEHVPVSATIGDLPCEPERVARAVEAVAAAGVDYVKIGIFPGGDPAATIARAGTLSLGKTRLVGVLLADLMDFRPPSPHTRRDSSLLAEGGRKSSLPNVRRDSPHPVPPRKGEGTQAATDRHQLENALGPERSVLRLLARAGFAGVLLDTAGKNGRPLPEIMSGGQLALFIDTARAHGLFAGLAGSLRLGHIPALLELRSDILGFRGALCAGGDRTNALHGPAVKAVAAALANARAPRDTGGAIPHISTRRHA